MLELYPININDAQWAVPLLRQSGNLGCEFNFANNLAWSRTYNVKVCRYKDFYVVGAGQGEEFRFMFPVGTGDYADVFAQMKAYSNSVGVPLQIYGISDATIGFIREHFDAFQLIEDRDSFDYIYKSSDLIELCGKKYHSKRNHLKRFCANFEAEYCDITERDFDDCIAFAAKSYNENMSYDDESAVGEQFAIHTFFENFDRLEMKGGVIRVGGQVCAFTLGSKISDRICDINIEKADRSFEGSYTAICNGFAKSNCAEFEYINREEDLGLEGLRKSKLSYYPEFLLKKYRIILK